MKLKTIILTSCSAISLNAMAFNLPQQPLLKYECTSCQALEHETIDFDWMLRDAPAKKISPLIKKSLSYQKVVSASQLQKGVIINTTADKAVIRITPQKPNKSVAPIQYTITNTGNESFALEKASDSFADKNALSQSPYFAGSEIISQLKPELGHGKFTIKADKLLTGDDSNYLIDIFDKYSSAYLSLTTDKINYFYNDDIKVTIDLTNDSVLFPISRIYAVIMNPKGEKFPLKLVSDGYNRYVGYSKLVSRENSYGENWYIRVDTETQINQEVIYRHATTAFSYALPSANIKSVKASNKDDYAFDATIEASTASRYALEATLFASDDSGKIHPVMITQSGHFLEPGTHKVHFSFKPENVELSKYHEPYSLGNLRLIDHGQIKPVYAYDNKIALSKLK
jgi:Domain of unknown function (DUF4785) N-terminal domain/Domain of unknown function (DUF4785) C-terminal domain/Domain of unknown function (DUF4785) central domain